MQMKVVVVGMISHWRMIGMNVAPLKVFEQKFFVSFCLVF